MERGKNVVCNEGTSGPIGPTGDRSCAMYTRDWG